MLYEAEFSINFYNKNRIPGIVVLNTIFFNKNRLQKSVIFKLLTSLLLVAVNIDTDYTAIT